MRRLSILFVALALVSLAACGGDSTAPNPTKQLSGDYHAVSVNGVPLPATFTVNYTFTGLSYSYQTRVVARNLNLIGNLGMWSDSTEFTVGGVWQGYRTGEFIKWWISGNGITVVSSNPQHGDFALFFTLQPDGSLVSTDSSLVSTGMSAFTETVVYRR